MMKSNLEQNFKDALDKYEMPYNPKAWEALNSKLDAMQPATKPASGSSLKWIGGISAAVVASSALIYAVMNNSTSTEVVNPTTTAQNTTQTVAPSNNEKSTSKQVETKTTSKSNAINSLDESNKETNSTVVSNNATQRNATSTTKTEVETNEKNTSYNPIVKTPEQNNTNNDKMLAVEPSTPANLFNELNDLCLGESEQLKNKNAFPLTIISPSGNEQTVAANQSVKFNPTESGTYTIASKNQKRTIVVKDAPKLDFEINEEVKYENGIPSIPLKTYADASNFVWSFEGQSTKQYGETATAHFYKQGEYTISLSAKNVDGCVATVKKQVSINENYNLLAPTAFMPKSADSRKNKFIPYALTVRNTEFKMTIYEPRTGNVVFETTSIDGWDGIDINTRQMVDENKSFAWKVVLAHPEPDEPKEYSGIVVRM